MCTGPSGFLLSRIATEPEMTATSTQFCPPPEE